MISRDGCFRGFAARTQSIRFTSVAAFVGSLILAGICFYFPRVADPDLWWHIKAGEIIAISRDVPRIDFFSFTAPAARWIDHSWATDLLFYLVYGAFGDSGLTFLKSAIGLGLAGVLWSLTKSAHLGTQILVFLLAAQIIGRFFLYRPQILTYLFLAILLRMLLRRKTNETFPPLAGMVALFAVWANFHGGFLAGLALVAFHAGWSCLLAVSSRSGRREKRRRAARLTGLLVVCAAATLANPYGVRLWEMLWREVAVNPLNHRYINEWTSMSLQGLDTYLVLLMAAIAAISLVLRPKAWKSQEVALCLGTFALSVYSVRHMPLFALVCAAPLAKALGLCMSECQSSRAARSLFLVALGIVLVPALLTAHLVFQSPAPAIRIQQEAIGGDPSGAVAFLRANNVRGNLFNPLEWGGYLIWHKPDGLRISVDGRSSMIFPKQVLLDGYRFYGNEAPTRLPLDRGADFVLVGARSPVALRLSSDVAWTLVYSDLDALLFAGPTAAGKRVVQRTHAGELTDPLALIPKLFP